MIHWVHERRFELDRPVDVLSEGDRRVNPMGRSGGPLGTEGGVATSRWDKSL